jgi:hypothetical protein
MSCKLRERRIRYLLYSLHFLQKNLIIKDVRAAEASRGMIRRVGHPLTSNLPETLVSSWFSYVSGRL